MSRLTAIDSIAISNRQRREFKRESLEDLAKGIESKGLMHPVVCSVEPGNQLKLVAGERRLRAMRMIWQRDSFFNFNGSPVAQGQVPYVLLTDLDSLQLREAELEENILREDLTWLEYTDAINELQALREEQRPEHTRQDTAREIAEVKGMSFGSARRHVDDARVVGLMRDDEEVTNAKTQREAAKIARRKLTDTFNQQIISRNLTGSKNKIIHGDFFELEFKEKFDCIIADPPYGIGADSFGDAAANEHKYDDSPEAAMAFLKEFFIKAAAICKPRSHMYVFCDVDHFTAAKRWATAARWRPWRVPMVWDHGPTGHAPRPNHGPRRNYEIIIFSSMGDRPVNALQEDVIHIPNLKDRRHAAQKPVDLYVDLLRRSCNAGDLVLDPCCGAGTIFPAANKLGLRATGVEKSEEWVKYAKTRLEEKE